MDNTFKEFLSKVAELCVEFERESGCIIGVFVSSEDPDENIYEYNGEEFFNDRKIVITYK